MTITIVDYGMGNLGSIKNMFKRIGVSSHICDTAVGIERAEKIVLPGVGSFDQAMNRIDELGFRDSLNEKVMNEKVPILGICLGMQLLVSGSEEGDLPGLDWIRGRAIRIQPKDGIKVPHMGWNQVQRVGYSKLIQGLPNDSRFYFVHSYAVHCDDRDNSILRSVHGVEFDSAIQKDNIYGVQFHPEKSHKFGMELFKSFASL